jgi:hypothetical protein
MSLAFNSEECAESREMTKFRYLLLILAVIVPARTWASPLADVFAPRELPRLTYASLPVPVPVRTPVVPPASTLEPATEAPEPTFWERLKSLFE